MVRKAVNDAGLPSPGGAYSQAVLGDGLVFVAGQVGRDPATGELPTDLEQQVQLAIDNIERVLVAIGSGLPDVAKTTCFLSDIGDFAAFDAAYRARFPQPWPARSTVGVQLAPGLRVEIEAIAFSRSRED